MGISSRSRERPRAPFNRNLLNELLDLAAGGCATLKQAQFEALGVTL